MQKKQLKPKCGKNFGKYRNYLPEALQKALVEVKQGNLPVKRAAVLYGLPVQTLRDHVKGNVKSDKNKDTLFSHEEELSLIEHVEAMAQLGYGLTNTSLKDLGGELAKALGKKEDAKALSNCWLYGFVQRWNQRISQLRPSSLETNRAKATTPEIVDYYFKNLEKVILENGLADKPHCIFNVDETGIQPEHKPPNILAPVHGKAQSVTSPRSTTTTIIACANAVGTSVPPYFIFKGKRFQQDLAKGSSPGARFTMSETGWSNADLFRDYLQNHFIPNVRRGEKDDQPILLILDGHATHISKQVIEWAVSQHLILFVLPAHSSHVLQPLDVAVFGPFKGYYYRECAAFMRQNMGKAVTKYSMTEIACKAYLHAMTPANIISAFKKTGIHPLNKEAINSEKTFSK